MAQGRHVIRRLASVPHCPVDDAARTGVLGVSTQPSVRNFHLDIKPSNVLVTDKHAIQQLEVRPTPWWRQWQYAVELALLAH